MAARDQIEIHVTVKSTVEIDNEFGTVQDDDTFSYDFIPAASLVDTVLRRRITQNTSTVPYDLRGSLTDPTIGGTRAFATVHVIILKKNSGAGQAKLGGGASAAAFFSDATDVLVGKDFTMWVNTTGWAMTDSSADILQIETDGTFVGELRVCGLKP